MSAIDGVSEIFDAEAWDVVPGFEDLTDLTYHRARAHGTVRVAFDRPEVRNAFRPHTVDELYTALDHARQTSTVGCVLLTGNGPSPKDGGWAFCSGGDQRIRGKDGYQYENDDAGQVDRAKLGRLHILEVQRLIRHMPKVVIAVVPGWAAGGGHSLHVVCDLTIASKEHAIFRQTDANVASFDAGYGSALLARQVGQKRAREIFFLAPEYSADEAFQMGAINLAVPHAELERKALEWAATINAKSPTAIRMLKYAFNLPDEGLVGQQLFAGEATRLGYGTDEAQEGRDAFLEKRRPRLVTLPLVLLTDPGSTPQPPPSRPGLRADPAVTASPAPARPGLNLRSCRAARPGARTWSAKRSVRPRWGGGGGAGAGPPQRAPSGPQGAYSYDARGRPARRRASLGQQRVEPTS